MYSGKGGVGKTTLAVNLAYYLHRQNLRVGICDADLNSPSVTSYIRGVNPSVKMKITPSLVLEPSVFDGVKVSSTGLTRYNDKHFVISDDYIAGALHQMLLGVNWEVDFLIIDLPPGFSNIHSEIVKFFKTAKMFLVTDSKYISYADSLFGIQAFKKLDINLIGIIDNFYSAKKDKEIDSGIELYNKTIKHLQIKESEKIDSLNSKGVPYTRDNKDADPFFSKIFELIK